MQETDTKPSRAQWEAAYLSTLMEVVESHPDYEFWRRKYPTQEARRAAAEDMAPKVLPGLLAGSWNLQGEAIKAACKACGIRQTYKAIREAFA